MNTKPGDAPQPQDGETAPAEQPDIDRRAEPCDPVSEPAADPLVFMGLRWDLLHVTSPAVVRFALSPRTGSRRKGTPRPGALS